MKEKSVNEILKVIADKRRVRNFGIVAHVDSGKTTTADSLLAACGMLNPDVAGKALALDFMKLEQQRQMTIKAANVTLYYDHEGVPYVFNMIDTPGHIDFSGRVVRSLRALDGAVVVVDAVEGVATQTETVTRLALQERVKPVLYVNKIDRLVKELKLSPEKMQDWLARIVSDFNNLVSLYAEPEYKHWQVSAQNGSVAFGSAKDRWGFTLQTAKKAGMSFRDVFESYAKGELEAIQEKLPLHEAILSMVVNHHPSPVLAQRYRIEKIWKGDLESDLGKALLACDDNGPTVMMVTNVVIDQQAGLITTGRLFSGTVRDGDTLYLMDSKTQERAQKVSMYMGADRRAVHSLSAGNIPAILGLQSSRSGETIASVKKVTQFEPLKYVSEPVVTVAIEPKRLGELPKLIEALKKMQIEDPTMVYSQNRESGESLLSGMGVLHLEIAESLLKEQGIETVVSNPLVNYRETIQNPSPIVMARSPNNLNKLFVRVEPLEEKIVEKIRSGELGIFSDKKTLQTQLVVLGFSNEEARRLVSIDENGNLLTDETKGVQYMDESMSSFVSGFEASMKAGPITQERCRGVKVVINHFVPHIDPTHRTFAQLMPAMRSAIFGAMLSAKPTLLEPIQGIEVSAPMDCLGQVSSVLSKKRGKTLSVSQREAMTLMEGEVPVSETFDLTDEIRSATAGRAMPNLFFKRWSAVPASLYQELVLSIRKRNGLPEALPSASDFVE